MYSIMSIVYSQVFKHDKKRVLYSTVCQEIELYILLIVIIKKNKKPLKTSS